MIEVFNGNNILNKVKNEKMDICVICYGGSSSNTLVDTLIKNNYICRTLTWRKILCHCPEIININIPIIYIYRDPILAFLSMKRRGKGWWDTNQKKLSNNSNVKLSDENLLKLMIKQFKMWTNYKINNKTANICIIKYEELFLDTINEKLKFFLNNNNLKYFPITYIKPKTNNNLTNTDKLLFEKYKLDIDYINNFNINKYIK